MNSNWSSEQDSMLPDDYSDVSGGRRPSHGAPEHAPLVKEEIADRKQFRQLRRSSFIGAAFLIGFTALLLLFWTTSFGVRFFFMGFKAEPGHDGLILAPIVVMATLILVPMLAIVRFVFRQSTDDVDENDKLSIWQTLIKEIADVIKQYAGRGKATS
jgi:hypothetical protein